MPERTPRHSWLPAIHRPPNRRWAARSRPQHCQPSSQQYATRARRQASSVRRLARLVVLGLVMLLIACATSPPPTPTPSPTVAPTPALTPAPTPAPATVDLAVAGGQTTITVADARGAPLTVITESEAVLPAPFLKFVVVAPHNDRTIYVTARSLGMEGAQLWLVVHGQAKRLLNDLGDAFWTAQPVWCQTGPGQPGVIAYVLTAPATPDRTGLELWLIGGDGGGARRLLEGAPQNGFSPDLFYGERRTPLRFDAACGRLTYSSADGRVQQTVTLGSSRGGPPAPAAARRPAGST